jgi:hypothetical protein
LPSFSVRLAATKVNDARELLHQDFSILMQADLNTAQYIGDAREKVAAGISLVEKIMDNTSGVQSSSW